MTKRVVPTTDRGLPKFNPVGKHKNGRNMVRPQTEEDVFLLEYLKKNVLARRTAGMTRREQVNSIVGVVSDRHYGERRD